MLLPMIDLLNEARKGGYAVAAPNVWNEENTRDAIAAAEEMNAPVILDYVYNARVYDFMLYAKPLCERSRVPIEDPRCSCAMLSAGVAFSTCSSANSFPASANLI